MSGYKHATVTISQEEYRRLHEADMKKRLSSFKRIEAQDSGKNEMVQSLLKELEDRESQLQAALGSIGQFSNQDDQAILQNLLNQNAMFYENLIANVNDVNLDVEASFSKITDNLLLVMESDRENINQSLQFILNERDTIRQEEKMKESAAQQWMIGCQTLVEFIQNEFDHERFNPGRLNKILRQINLAESNLSNGFFESCLQIGQQMYLELADMNFELEQIILQWQASYEQTYRELEDIVNLMLMNGKVFAVGLQGEVLQNDVDLNFWTNGRYMQLLSHSRQLSSNLIQDQNITTLEDLDRIYYQILPVIRESFESLLFDARLNALNSQLRMNIAGKALLALENHGFFLESSCYSDNDMRSEFNAHLTSSDGSQVTINVLPSNPSGQELSNELVVITSYPYLKTDHEARMQWDELSQTLAGYNLKVNHHEDETLTANTPLSDLPSSEVHLEQRLNKVER